MTWTRRDVVNPLVTHFQHSSGCQVFFMDTGVVVHRTHDPDPRQVASEVEQRLLDAGYVVVAGGQEHPCVVFGWRQDGPEPRIELAV